MTKYEFMDKVDSALNIYPGSITSGRRSHKRNKRVGGHPRSLHLCGLAVDVVLDSENKSDSVHFKVFCKRLGLKVVVESDHFHLQIP